jgi:hypothetical protein
MEFLGQWSIWHVVTVVFGVVATLAMILNSNLKLRWGDKEWLVGKEGKKSEDIILKDTLFRITADIDHRYMADIFDIADRMKVKFEQVITEKHCWFTLYRFTDLIYDEVLKRIRRNNLKIKLSEQSIESYINDILQTVGAEYAVLQAKAKLVKCEEQYPDWKDIETDVRDILSISIHAMKKCMITLFVEKVKLYEEYADKFCEKTTRENCIDKPIEKNKNYIKAFGGEL